MIQRQGVALRKSSGWIRFILILCLTMLPGLSVLRVSAASQKKIVLNESSVLLETTQDYYLELLNVSGKVKWSSSDKTVATVDSSGKITAKGAGSCRIAAKYKSKKYYCSVTVVKPEVKLSRTSVSLEEKQTYRLALNNAETKVKWGTTDKSVATVSASGKITAKKAGTCKVYAKCDGKKYYCKVTVSKKAVLSRSSATLLKKKTLQLKLKNAAGTVTWSSSDETVATVSSTGKITTKKAGTCRIIARYKKKNYVCTVKVYNTNAEWMPDSLVKKYKVSSNKGKVVLAGSSSIDYWDDAETAFAPLEVINMGIAGSKAEDWIQLYPRLIAKYEPEAVVLYVGGNNIKGGMSGKQTAALIRTLLKKMREAMPDTKIYYVGGNPSIKCWSVWEQMKISNKSVKNFCSTQENMYYISIAKYFLGEDGLPDATYLRSDKLHPNAAGYGIWKKYVAGRVKKDLL